MSKKKKKLTVKIYYNITYICNTTSRTRYIQCSFLDTRYENVKKKSKQRIFQSIVKKYTRIPLRNFRHHGVYTV